MTSTAELIGAVCAPLAIAVAIIIYFGQRKRKARSYSVSSATGLLQVRDSRLQRRVTVLVDDMPVHDITVVQMRIRNDGNTPILSSDYEDLLTIEFDPNDEVISADCSTRGEQKIETKLTVVDNLIALDPCLLNQKDSIAITSLVSRYTKPPVIRGRIVGVPVIKTLSDSPKSKDRLWMMISLSASLILLATSILGTVKMKVPFFSEHSYLTGWLIGAALVVCFRGVARFEW